MDIYKFELMCRTCLSKSSTEPIFTEDDEHSTNFSDMLIYCTAVKAEKGDRLPSQICKPCVTNLITFYKFKRSVVENDFKLRQVLTGTENGLTARSDSVLLKEANIKQACHRSIRIETDTNCTDKENTDFKNIRNSLNLAQRDSYSIQNEETSCQAGLNGSNYLEMEEESRFSRNEKSCGTYNETNKASGNCKKVVNEDVDQHSVLQCHTVLHGYQNQTTDVKQESLGELLGKEYKSINDAESKQKVKKKQKSTLQPLVKNYQCEMCGKFLSCPSSLMQHLRHHTGEKPFGCDLCDKKFARSEHLTVHRRIHTGERPHSCTVCKKTFIQYAALTAHLRTHSGEKPHMCSICGKTFSQSVSLTYHTRTHTGETPFRCVICGKGFAHSGNLNIHVRFHRNERPFACTLCPRRFVTSSHLTVHVKQHTGDKAHQCNVCGKAFVRSEHLKDHLVIHSGQKPHCCLLCPKRYTQSSHLSRHMKTHKA